MKALEQIESIYQEARSLKDIARKSTDQLEHFIKAAEYLHKAATLSAELALKSEHDIDLKSQTEIFSLYYSYEEQDCLACYYYEKHDTEIAKSHLSESNVYLSKAVSLIEALPPSVSSEVRQKLSNLLPNYKYRCQSIEVRVAANDARAAWDEGRLVEALDIYRSTAARQEKLLVYLKEHNLSPVFQRIERDNFITLMVNTSSTMARITIENSTKDEQDILKLPSDLFTQLLKYTADAYYLGMAAYKQNPEWRQSHDNALHCLEYLQSILRMNQSAWLQLYIEFEDNPDFLKIMRTTDIEKFKEVEGRFHNMENGTDKQARDGLTNAEQLYERVKSLYQNTKPLDQNAAKLVTELADDAIKEFGNTNQEKKVELKQWKAQAELVLPPATIEDLRKRAEGQLLKKSYPKNKFLRNVLLGAVALIVVFLGLLTLRKTLTSNETRTAPSPAVKLEELPKELVERRLAGIEVKLLDRSLEVTVRNETEWEVREIFVTFTAFNRQNQSIGYMSDIRLGLEPESTGEAYRVSKFIGELGVDWESAKPLFQLQIVRAKGIKPAD